MKKFLLVILSFVAVLSLSLFYETKQVNALEDENTVTLTILNQNVDGLPVKSLFTEEKKVTAITTAQLGKAMNKANYDVICVQEDFQYHDILKAQLKNYTYSTYSSGGIPVGDGLNIFSKYPIYNVERVTWNQSYGIWTNYNDQLTPKGFLKVTLYVRGMYVDLYDIHADAGSQKEDREAKLSQFNQLVDYIKVNSSNNPVIIVGDFNDDFHSDGDRLYSTFIKKGGFTDCWAKMNNDEYFTNDKQSKINYYQTNFGSSSGNWDSIERMMYKENSDVSITCNSFVYSTFNDKSFLTDHNCSITSLTLHKNVIKSEKLVAQTKDSLLTKVTKTVKAVSKTLSLLIKGK